MAIALSRDLAQQVAETAAAVVASGAISANGHGNISIRIPNSSEMLFSTAPTLRGLDADMVARIRLDGEILEGDVPPINKAVIDMHTAIYADQLEAGCVIHTHSPYATAFAVARRRIDCWIEALAMFGLADGVPVAEYGPRGSAQAVRPRPYGTSAPRSRRAGARCCWRTTACWSSTARRHKR
jgi:L-ribulose-5-phosphate 4-epimerase